MADYLEDYPGSSLDEVHKATNVPRNIILAMIRSNRILSGMMSYPCESCKEPIVKGRICQKCADAAIQYFSPRETSTVEPSTRPGAMYIRHKADRRR